VPFAAEVDYATVFASARIAVDERRILTDLGHPQPQQPSPAITN
jgi:hypothetical protein